jgi:hypothetical protein
MEPRRGHYPSCRYLIDVRSGTDHSHSRQISTHLWQGPSLLKFEAGQADLEPGQHDRPANLNEIGAYAQERSSFH